MTQVLVLLDLREDDARTGLLRRSKFSTIGRSESSKMLSASMTHTLSRSTNRSVRPSASAIPPACSWYA